MPLGKRDLDIADGLWQTLVTTMEEWAIVILTPIRAAPGNVGYRNISQRQ
jgi:hypothetical protein